MKVFNCSEASQDLSTVLNTALKEDVIIAQENGNKFKIVPLQEKDENSLNIKVQEKGENSSDIKEKKSNITMNDVINAIKKNRER
jgi:PHD/YefM family antitoxin component YafN of YafNO toxin-antitoxin module